MPTLWNETIESHKEAVSDAIFAATAKLMSDGGLVELSMARIAQEAGIGRATLYKYFSDVDELLAAWHQRAIAEHLALLSSISAAHSDALEALQAVLTAYVDLRRHDHGHAVGLMLHNLPHVHHAQEHLRDALAALITAAVKSKKVRADIPAQELAGFALAAIESAAGRSKAEVRRAVGLIIRAIGVA